MRKFLLLVLVCVLISNFAMAKVQINFITELIDPKPLGHPPGKSPIQPPTVYIEDHTLSFAVDHPDYLLNIKDEDGDVVFTTVVYSAQTEVVLPLTLSGDYEIELVMGNWLFSGWINL